MDAILKNNFQNILAGYELVADYTVSGSAITNYDFTGLNITKEDDYILVSDIKNTSSSCGYTLFVNGNNTATNYYQEKLYAYTTVVGGFRANTTNISFTATGNRTLSISKIKLTNNGYFVFQSKYNQNYVGSGIEIGETSNTSTFTATNITSLRVNAETSNQIDVSSRFQLYKRVAPIIADITVSSATTSVDITGLSIDKGSEYMLVSDIVGVVANSSIYLFSNGNTTTTNYWYQGIDIDGTTIGGNRTNNPAYFETRVGYRAFANCDIKLTNNGYIEFQSNSQTRYGTSTLFARKHNGTSTFTATSITQLTITSSVANGIGIGSRFQLIKLK